MTSENPKFDMRASKNAPLFSSQTESQNLLAEEPNFLKVYNSPAFKHAYYTAFPNPFEENTVMAVNRPGAIMFARKNEGSILNRLLLLKPYGHTSDNPSELNAYPETRWTKTRVYGAVHPHATRFSLLKNAIRFCYYDTPEVQTISGAPYAPRDPSNPRYFEKEKAARAHFFTVKENGFGFFHNLINQTDEWLLLKVEKQLLDRREPAFEPKLAAFNKDERQKAQLVIEYTARLGTESFYAIPQTIDYFIALDPQKTVPLLIEALNLRENGRHNPCTAFCILLKIAKKHPQTVITNLQRALREKTAPSYYLEDLLNKISKSGL